MLEFILFFLMLTPFLLELSIKDIRHGNGAGTGIASPVPDPDSSTYPRRVLDIPVPGLDMYFFFVKKLY